MRCRGTSVPGNVVIIRCRGLTVPRAEPEHSGRGSRQDMEDEESTVAGTVAGSDAVVIDIEKREEIEERLRKQGWYLGEINEEVATSILLKGPRSNTFAVYSSQGDSTADVPTYILSARFSIEGIEEDIVEHLHLSCTDKGGYQLQGQSDEYSDVIAAVNSYVTGREPPLTPALGKSLQIQLSIPDDPPSYSQVDRTLAPDIVPLPDVGALKIDIAKEAKTGQLTPVGSFQWNRARNTRSDGTTPPHINNPHWYRYRDHCCLHPKNIIHCCCYRETHWTGRREIYSRKWYSLCDTGPLRLLGLLVLFLTCGVCIGCGLCCYYLIMLCCLVCFYDES